MRIDIPLSGAKKMQEENLFLTNEEVRYLINNTLVIPSSVASLKVIVDALEAQFMDKPEVIDLESIKHFFALKAKVKRGTN